jgi:hypothetical protein
VIGSHIHDTKDKDGSVIPGLLFKTPHVEVETLNGERVVFPAFRPDMLPFPVPNVDERRVRSDTISALDKLESENADMREALAEMNKRLDAEIRKREGYED